MRYSELFTTSSGRKVLAKGAPTVLIIFALFFLFLVASGCSSMEEVSHEIDQVADAGYSVEAVVDQVGDTFRQTKQATKEAANVVESVQASYGGQKVCITPGLNIGPKYSMTFQIPGRTLTVKNADGSKQKAESVRLTDFETANTIFRVNRFASFMQSYIVVKIYKNGKPYDMLKERIRDRYSKEDLIDRSCSAYFVEARDRRKDLELHNGN